MWFVDDEILRTELEVDDVSVLDNLGEDKVSCCNVGRGLNTYIRLSLLSVLSSSLDWAHGLSAFTEIVEVLVGDNFSLDEASLEVAVDGSSSLRCQTSSWDSPASNLLLTSYVQVSEQFNEE